MVPSSCGKILIRTTIVEGSSRPFLAMQQHSQPVTNA